MSPPLPERENVVDIRARRVGHCPICGRAVSINADYVRVGRFVLHRPCAHHKPAGHREHVLQRPTPA
jgi:hypothetical protein